MNNPREITRKAALSNILQVTSSPELSSKMSSSIKKLPEDAIKMIAEKDKIPEDQYEIYKSLIKGEPNKFLEDYSKVDGTLRPGDIILMTGNSHVSKALVAAQKAIYTNVRSSHVAIVHADFICIDAIPSSGVSNRLIHEVLSDVEENWRAIRFSGIQENHTETIMRACSYYFAQPYKIKPSKKPGKDFAYCSELARKIYDASQLDGTGIFKGPIIAPAHFDKLADHNSDWTDITEDTRHFVDVCKKYPALLKVTSRLFIEGLKLNRTRFDDRKKMLKNAQLALSRNLITKEQYLKMVKEVKDIESSLNHQFWDTK